GKETPLDPLGLQSRLLEPRSGARFNPFIDELPRKHPFPGYPRRGDPLLADQRVYLLLMNPEVAGYFVCVPPHNDDKRKRPSMSKAGAHRAHPLRLLLLRRKTGRPTAFLWRQNRP